MAKNQNLHIRLSAEEKNALESISRIQGFKTISDYLRNIAIKKGVSGYDKETLNKELTQIITLLQSLIYKVNNL